MRLDRLMAKNYRSWNRQIPVVQMDVSAANTPHLNPGNQRTRLRVEHGRLLQRQWLVEGAENSSACHCYQ